ncbi:50S ribosomal protein L19 [soil metagenome]
MANQTDKSTKAPMPMQMALENINAAVLKTDVPRMEIGDTVAVHTRIVEGTKERIQVFTGVLIARAGRGITEMITVRRLVEEMGVERIFPLNSPRIAQYQVIRRGQAARAKLYYLRERTGRAQRVIDRRRKLKHVAGLAVQHG